jgi:hypothetical protein
MDAKTKRRARLAGAVLAAVSLIILGTAGSGCAGGIATGDRT